MLDLIPSGGTFLRSRLTRALFKVGQLRKLALVATVLAAPTAADAKIIYVNGGDTTPGNGTSWNLSFKYLRDALDASLPGDQIYVAKGFYYPDDGASGEFGNRELSFELDGVKIYGGFVGNETSLSQRNPALNPTVLSGEIWDQPGEDIHWSLHVVEVSESSTLDGVTVERGHAQGSVSWNYPAINSNDQGGGCYVKSGKTLTLKNCIFTENRALSFGGAIMVEDTSGSVVATDCTFDQNHIPLYDITTSAPEGGAIKGKVKAINCKFTTNTIVATNYVGSSTSSAKGGAISGDVTATGCDFTGNTVTATAGQPIAAGGAISGNVVASKCIFTANEANAVGEASDETPIPTPFSYGGAINGGSLQAANCVFSENKSGRGKANDDGTVVGGGGAVYVSSGSSSVVNSVFVKNTSRISGGAIHSGTTSYSDILTVTDSTFLDNGVATPSEGAAIGCGGMVRIMNNIFWSTADTDGDFDQTNLIHVLNKGVLRNTDVHYPTPATIAQNLVKGGISSVTRGDGGDRYLGDEMDTLLTGDPLFVSTADLDGVDGKWGTEDDGLRLTTGSSAIGVDRDPRITSFRNFVPADTFDVDKDGNVTELLPIDIANYVRKQGTPTAYVDMGAYEFGNILHVPEIYVAQSPSIVLEDGGPVRDFSLLRGITQTFTIKNTGAGDLMNLKVIGDGVDISSFKFTQPAVTKLAANQSTTFTVNFNPTGPGPRTAAIHIASNDSDENTFDISLKGTPPVPDIAVEYPVNNNLVDGTAVIAYGNVGLSFPITKTFIIRNTGTGNLSLAGITSSSADFKVSGLGQTSLAPGSRTTFNVTFSPSGIGLKKASIIIANNDFDAESQFLIQVTGNGIAPDIAVEYPAGTGLTDGSSVINYGGVLATSSASRIITIRNSGIANLNILGISSTGTNAANFTASAPARSVLAPGVTTTFKLTFKPSGIGARNASIVIRSNDPDGESAFIVKVTGSGLGAPEIFVSQPYSAEIVDGATNDFGSVQKTLLHSKTFIIKNTGLGTLGNIAVSLSGSPAFSKTPLPVTSLSPGAQTKFTVTFKPGSLGKKTAALQITSNDANEGDLDINLVGTCIAKTQSTAADSLVERRSKGSGGVVTVTKDSEGLKYLVLTVEKSPNWASRKHTVEVSPNLMDWFSGRKHTTTLVNNAKILKVRDNTPIRDGKKRYIRVR